MPGGTTTQQQSTQQSQTAPWSAAQPLLNNIIGGLSATNPAVTPAQTAGYGMLSSEASEIPNFAPQATDVANEAVGTSTAPQQGILTGANNNLQNELSPYLSSSFLNPLETPGFSAAMSGLNQGITNQVNDQFAAAGRDLSPGNTQALATGLSQGEGQLIANQYNTNAATQLGAANEAFGGANTTASGLTAQQLAQLQAQSGGLGIASQIPGLALAPGSAAEGVATSQAQQPYTNMGWLSSLAYPLGALGSTSTGTGSNTTTQQTNPLSNILGLGLGGLGILGGTGAFGSSGYLNPNSSNFAFSDERVKEEIEPIGMLYDDTPVYSYKYIKELDPDQTPRIGVMAQDIEKIRPDAVKEFGGIKAVDYSMATERARLYGMLADLDLAA